MVFTPKKNRLSRWSWVILLPLLLFFVIGCREAAGTGPRVLLIGVEGVSWDLLQAMVKAGEAPNFARFKTEGAWGLLESTDPIHPASIWNTIATGRIESDHGVHHPNRYDEIAGRLTIPSRSAATVWEIAARRKMPAGVIGWPVSNPLPDELAVRIDDLVFYRGLEIFVPNKGTVLTVPAQLPADQSPYVGRVPKGGMVNARIENASLTWMPKLAAEAWPKVRVLAVFLDGLNSARHYAGAARALGFKQPLPSFGKPTRKHLQQVDEALGKLLDLADEQTLIMLASDDPAYLPSSQLNTGEFVHPVHGIVGLLGAMIVVGRQMDTPTILDFAPMALTHLGIPLSEEMMGNPFEEAWSALPPKLPRVATHDVFIRRPYPPGSSLRNQGVVERLRAMSELAQAGVGPFNDRNTYALELLRAGNLRGATDEVMADLTTDATNPVGQYIFGEILIEKGNRVVAIESFHHASAALTDKPVKEPERSIRTLVGLAAANVRLSLQQPELAALELGPVLRLCEDCTAATEVLADCHLAMNDPDKAIAILQRALKKNPSNPKLLIALGRARLKKGDPQGATEAWRAALSHGEKNVLAAHLELGLLAVRESNWKEAQFHLRQVIQLDPQNAYAWFELASVYANQNKNKKAENALVSCLRADPTQKKAWLAWRKLKQAEGDELSAARLLAFARECVAIGLLSF